MQGIGYVHFLTHELSNGQRTFPLAPTERSPVTVYCTYQVRIELIGPCILPLFLQTHSACLPSVPPFRDPSISNLNIRIRSVHFLTFLVSFLIFSPVTHSSLVSCYSYILATVTTQLTHLAQKNFILPNHQLQLHSYHRPISTCSSSLSGSLGLCSSLL